MPIQLDIFGHPIYKTSDNKVLEVNKYFYDINFTLIDRTENAQYKLNDSLLAMKIHLDYKRYVFPIIMIKLSLSNENYKILRDHDVEVRLDIDKILIHDDSTPNPNRNLDRETYIKNELFTIIDKNKIIYNDDDLNDDVPSLDMLFTLFAKKHLAINKLIFNGNYLNTRLVDILALSTSGILDNILIERPDNMTKFNQLFIPPINASKLPRYLQNNYSIYKSGIISFFGLKENIICSTTIGSKTPLSNNDYLHVIFDLQSYNNTDTMPYECGYKTSNGEYYYIKTQETNLKISDKTRINQEIFGSRNIVFSKKENLSTEEIEWNEHDENKLIDKRQLYYDNYNNPYPLHMSYINEPIKAIFMFNNLDIDTFKPNKLFFCNLNGKEYQLRVLEASFVFKKDTNNNTFSCNGTCLFEKNI